MQAFAEFKYSSDLHSIVQVELHPSELTVFESSHDSGLTTNPSPHLGVHTEVAPRAPVHPYPVSIKQAVLHPSPFPTALSQASPEFKIVFPQVDTQFERVVFDPPVQLHPATFPVQLALHSSAPLVF